MKCIADLIEKIPWIFLTLACLTLGLAPFNPPHIVEKLKMLSRGELKKCNRLGGSHLPWNSLDSIGWKVDTFSEKLIREKI